MLRRLVTGRIVGATSSSCHLKNAILICRTGRLHVGRKGFNPLTSVVNRPVIENDIFTLRLQLQHPSFVSTGNTPFRAATATITRKQSTKSTNNMAVTEMNATHSLSTVLEHDENYESAMSEEEMQRFVQKVLNAKETPVGTLTQDEIDLAFEIIDHYLFKTKGREMDGPDGNIQNYSSSSSSSSPTAKTMTSNPAAFSNLDCSARLLQRMTDECAFGNNKVAKRHDSMFHDVYKMVLEGWIVFGGKIGTERADWTLQRMVELHLLQNLNVPPETDHFIALVQMWLDYATSEKDTGAIRKAAEIILFATDRNEMVPADADYQHEFTILFHNVLGLVSENLQFDESFIPLGFDLLKRMDELDYRGWEGIKPDITIRERVLQASSTKTTTLASGGVRHVIKTPDSPPGNITRERKRPGRNDTAEESWWNHLQEFNRIAKTTEEKGGSVENLVTYFRTLLDLSANKKSIALPELAKCLETVVHTLAKRGMGKKAEEILNLAIQKGVNPTISTCRDMIQAHVHSGGVFHVVPVLERLERTCKTDKTMDPKHLETCYETSIMALLLSKTNGSYRKAVELLTRMIDSYQSDEVPLEPTKIGYICDRVLVTLKRQKRIKDADSVLRQLESSCMGREGIGTILTVSSYVRIMTFWADSGRVDQVEKTFHRLLHHYRSGNTQLKPNVASFAIVLKAISKSRAEDAATKTDDILCQMIDMYRADNTLHTVDDGPFNSVILAYKDVGNEEALERACGIIHQMAGLGIHPTTFTFNTVLSAFMKRNGYICDAAEKSVNLLDLMIHLYEKGGNTKAKPEAFTFDTVMTILAATMRDENDDEDGGGTIERMFHLFKQMERLKIDPTLRTYNTILEACAVHECNDDDETEKRATLKIAVETMGRLRKSTFGPSVKSYDTVLGAYLNLVPEGEDRDKLVISTFKCCCVDGLMSKRMLNTFRNMLSEDIFNKLVSCGRSDDDDDVVGAPIPMDWSRNLNETRSS